ncbi:C13 family peptidase [Povalibacter sp.]|uniref:C13 family peptidase n=1 Tax=Povalibacter sp. TaxID=1962978 RepID=UPI002F40580A
MNTLEITYSLTVADWRAYQAAWAQRLQDRTRLSRRAILSIVLLALGLACVLVLLAVQLQQPIPFLAVVVGACAAVLGVMINMRRLRKASHPDEQGVILGPGRLTFDDSGMRLEKMHSLIRHDWSVFQDITQSPEHLFVWIDRMAGLIVPIRDLPTDLTAAQVMEQIRAFASSAIVIPAMQAPPTNTVTAQSLSTSASSGEHSFWKSIAGFLLLRPVTQPALALPDRALCALALTYLASWLLLDWLTAAPGSTFYIYGLLGIGWYASLILLVAAIWARLSQPLAPFRSTLAVVLAFTPLAIALALLILQYVPDAAILGALILVAFYASTYGHAALRSLTARHQPQAMFAGLLVLSLAAWFAQTQYVTPQFWYPDDDAEASGEAASSMEQWRQMEALLFGQSGRIDAAVAAMERPDDLASAAFFLGFAGMGEQRVFAGEIALASEVIAENYGTGSRSLQLINDRRDLASQPFANTSALRQALTDIARRMNLDQDVLFLALSSHGSEDGQLSVSNLGMPVNNLSAQDLAEALDDSGIRWRVIIVSACYSGQFIEPLRNDTTIVITAAAPDRTSFGCADDRDLTYFGEAFYRDALHSSVDLRTAFQRAKAEIARREEQEDIEASHPQAHFGAAIERHLRGMRTANR